MTDKELAALLPHAEPCIEAIITKYIGGAMTAYDGETASNVADARIARQLMVKLRPWLPETIRSHRRTAVITVSDAIQRVMLAVRHDYRCQKYHGANDCICGLDLALAALSEHQENNEPPICEHCGEPLVCAAKLREELSGQRHMYAEILTRAESAEQQLAEKLRAGTVQELSTDAASPSVADTAPKAPSSPSIKEARSDVMLQANLLAAVTWHDLYRESQARITALEQEREQIEERFGEFDRQRTRTLRTEDR